MAMRIWQVAGAAGFAVLAQVGAAAAQGELCGAFPVGQKDYACTCTPDAAVGSVWGSGPYTADSNLCTAAYHAGVIGLDGGQVIARATGPQDSFVGTEQNGVVSSDWGAYPDSFMFDAPAPMLGELETCGVIPDENEIYRCQCDAVAMAGGPVWGSGPYTADSNICSAALHAGMVGPEGGVVLVARTGGLDAYAGSEANGVATSDWGAYGASIVFEVPLE
jgi:hypothetical protein